MKDVYEINTNKVLISKMKKTIQTMFDNNMKNDSKEEVRNELNNVLRYSLYHTYFYKQMSLIII